MIFHDVYAQSHGASARSRDKQSSGEDRTLCSRRHSRTRYTPGSRTGPPPRRRLPRCSYRRKPSRHVAKNVILGQPSGGAGAWNQLGAQRCQPRTKGFVANRLAHDFASGFAGGFGQFFKAADSRSLSRTVNVPAGFFQDKRVTAVTLTGIDPKAAPTFVETLAFVRQQLWSATISSTSPANADMALIPRAFLQRLTDAAGSAA